MAGHAAAQRAADALALALEEAGFDVGRAFPELRATGAARIETGPVTPNVATQLARLLTRASESGITLAVLED